MATIQGLAARRARALAEVVVVSTDSYSIGQGRPLPGLEAAATAQWAALQAQGVDAVDMESETVLTVGHAVGARGVAPRRAREPCDRRMTRGLSPSAAHHVAPRGARAAATS